MNAFEINKIVGAALMTLLLLLVVGQIGDALIPTAEEHAATTVRPAAPAAEPAAAATPAPVGILAALAGADAEKGRKVFKKCASCHTAKPGAGNRIGPNLWGVVGRPQGRAPGYAYSAALAGASGTWSYEALDAFLTKPKAAVPGTRMGFGGIKKLPDRANLIAFLRSLSDAPLPLP